MRDHPFWPPICYPVTDRLPLIRSLFEQYIRLYTGREPELTEHFSRNFSGYTGGGDFLVTDREQWVAITRQDFSEVPEPIDIEMLDLAVQDLAESVVVATAFFRIHLPIPDHILARETARLVLIFRLEGEDWKIVHSGISIPYHLVRPGEVYPIANLESRNRALALLVDERTRELERANRRLERLSNTDGLTGVANRRHFDHELERAWIDQSHLPRPLALLMIDVDWFKAYNDRYGHLAGDTCLQTIARCIAQVARREGESVARYGGEEFGLLVPGANLHTASQLAFRVQQAVWDLALPHEDSPFERVSVSVGVAACLPDPAQTPQSLVEVADAALFRAKQSGRNQVCMAE